MRPQQIIAINSPHQFNIPLFQALHVFLLLPSTLLCRYLQTVITLQLHHLNTIGGRTSCQNNVKIAKTTQARRPWHWPYFWSCDGLSWGSSRRPYSVAVLMGLDSLQQWACASPPPWAWACHWHSLAAHDIHNTSILLHDQTKLYYPHTYNLIAITNNKSSLALHNIHCNTMLYYEHIFSILYVFSSTF